MGQEGKKGAFGKAGRGEEKNCPGLCLLSTSGLRRGKKTNTPTSISAGRRRENVLYERKKKRMY